MYVCIFIYIYIYMYIYIYIYIYIISTILFSIKLQFYYQEHWYSILLLNTNFLIIID